MHYALQKDARLHRNSLRLFSAVMMNYLLFTNNWTNLSFDNGFILDIPVKPGKHHFKPCKPCNLGVFMLLFNIFLCVHGDGRRFLKIHLMQNNNQRRWH